MATRIKTIEYAFQSRNGAALATITRYDFSEITIYIPETSSRVFKHVRLFVSFRDNAISAASITSPIVGIKLGANAFNDMTPANPPTNSGENGHYVFEMHVTSDFDSYFGSGTSQTCQVGFQVTGAATTNITAKLIITYTYDDSSATTLAKTVRIPLDSSTGDLTTTLTEIGTNQIPALDTFLPESSKVYRAIWIEAIYNEYTQGTTQDTLLGLQIDSGTEHQSGPIESSLASSCSGWYIWDQTASPVWSTASAHAFKARGSVITNASHLTHAAFVLYVTYEYAASSTTVMNSLVLPVPEIAYPGVDVNGPNANSIDFWIEEPGTITLKQSGFLVSFAQTVATNFTVKIGSGNWRSYSELNYMFGGCCWFSQRIDSDGAAGSAISIARGKNTLKWQLYSASSSTMTPMGFGGFFFLNYTSGKHASGEGVHNHSVMTNVQSHATAMTMSSFTGTWFEIPETDWFYNSIIAVMDSVHAINSAAPHSASIAFKSAAGELSEGGYHQLPTVTLLTDGEMGLYQFTIHIPHSYGLLTRWSNDPETTRMALTASRSLRRSSMPASSCQLYFWYTYHSIKFSGTGTVSGSNGGTVNLSLFDATTRQLLATTSRVGNGSYTVNWFDNTRNVYVDAYEGSNYLGRSDIGTLS